MSSKVLLVGVMELLALAPLPASGDAPSIVPPKRLDAAEVGYPQGASGDATVVLVVVVDANGEVTDVMVREGAPPFSDAAVAAVRRWRFAPATKDDRPVAARIVASVGFSAPPSPAPPRRPRAHCPSSPGHCRPLRR